MAETDDNDTHDILSVNNTHTDDLNESNAKAKYSILNSRRRVFIFFKFVCKMYFEKCNKIIKKWFKKI